jgi:hypothetical protein
MSCTDSATRKAFPGRVLLYIGQSIENGESNEKVKRFLAVLA